MLRARLFCSLAAVLAATGVSASASAAPEQARMSDELADSMGVCTHLGYDDTPYGQNFEGVKKLLVESGIRHVRDGMHERLHDLAKEGIRATIIAEPGDGGGIEIVEALRDQIKAFNAVEPAAIEGVEGTNEPDLFWSKYHKNGYKGQGFPAGAIAFQQDLFTVLKADAATKDLTVFGISLGVTHTPDNPDNPLGNNGELAGFVDWGNFHPYPGGNAFNMGHPYGTIAKYYYTSSFPSIGIDDNGDLAHPIVLDIYKKPYAPKPMAATETGYSTHKNAVSEAVVGKYLSRLYLEFFRLGIQRTFVYEFVDEFEDPEGTNDQAHFGMVRRDLTPKPSYGAVKALLSAVADEGPSFAPKSLDLTIAPHAVTVKASQVRPGAGDTDVTFDRLQYVHHVLLQKRDGRFLLVLWHEISNADSVVTPPVELTPPDIPTTVTVGEAFAQVRLLAPMTDGSVEASDLDAKAGSWDLSVPDRPVILELVPEGALGSGGAGGGSNSSGGGGEGGASASGGGVDSGGSAGDADADGGCGCRTQGLADTSSSASLLLLALLAAARVRRRRA